MNGIHPTADQLERYRRRVAAPAELLEVDAHIASCDRCFEEVRDRHLTYEQAEAYVDGKHDAALAGHIAGCELCRNEAADLAKMRDVVVAKPRRAPLRWLAAAAVVLAFASLAALVFRREPPPPPTARPTPAPRVIALTKPPIIETLVGEQRVLRSRPSGRSFALHAPLGTVVLDDRPIFHWATVASARSYDVAVVDADSGAIVSTGSTAATTWQPETPLARGRTYSWQVTANTRVESILAPGPSAPEALFHVAEPVEVKGTPIQRGVALANLGVLDEAERELQRAGATDLLQQVRSWRHRAPTTTNGAQ